MHYYTLHNTACKGRGPAWCVLWVMHAQWGAREERGFANMSPLKLSAAFDCHSRDSTTHHPSGDDAYSIEIVELKKQWGVMFIENARASSTQTERKFSIYFVCTDSFMSLIYFSPLLLFVRIFGMFIII